ncbi:hypothetical protein A2Z22_05025 [Candidatus Woesebacteria bacterium RBG_16_34_12]|uniref:Uncharacterized protein n=1 Tax=Candidatus Woesebacteria bacterium RBG_16_34_12 TaxID=1802480 RepID=A0A1F7X9M7_9BACT|nr:MAG: hypothetical protein A2Z22_05025 [Candidatus Woesebacteria bacterium RBG_16_34_12]
MEYILNKILKIANLSDEEVKEFKEIFFQLLANNIIKTINKNDKLAFNSLIVSLEDTNKNPEKVRSVLTEAYKKPELKEKIDAAVGEVLDELVDTIAKSATEEQKQKILSEISS